MTRRNAAQAYATIVRLRGVQERAGRLHREAAAQRRLTRVQDLEDATSTLEDEHSRWRAALENPGFDPGLVGAFGREIWQAEKGWAAAKEALGLADLSLGEATMALARAGANRRVADRLNRRAQEKLAQQRETTANEGASDLRAWSGTRT